MLITEQILNGDIPVTEEQLRFLAKNHEKYDLTRLNVSQITNFSIMFSDAISFNQPIGNWDVSNGTNFSLMFSGARAFNQTINKWNVSNGTDFSYMFFNAAAFNQPIGNWDVSNGTNFSHMFADAISFNQPIGNWNVSNGNHFSSMFFQAKLFNQPIGNWDVSNGTDFNFMFSESISFNQPIGNWDVSKGIYFSHMFYNAVAFNQLLNNWFMHEKKIRLILDSNFNLSIQHGFEKIGFTENADQLSLIFKDSPDNPFLDGFNYNTKELSLIKSNDFYGFMDKNYNTYQIDTDKITIDELIDICDIKTIKEAV